jgi:acyl-CoA synthetase (AMP-forming)/AMP-acid ligase II
MRGVLTAFEDRKRTAGSLPALRWIDGFSATVGEGTAALTWDGYAHAVEREAKQLAAAGVEPSMVVALQLPASPRLFAVRLALCRLRASSAILSPRLPQKGLEGALDLAGRRKG